MKTILIFGGTGFIGRHLLKELAHDHRIMVFSRHPGKYASIVGKHVTIEGYDLADPTAMKPWFEKADGVINLTGENIGGGRWSPSFKEKVMNSRLEMGSFLLKAFDLTDRKPEFLIQGSATGYYGAGPSDTARNEDSESLMDSFLTEVAVSSEAQIADLEAETRLVYLRTGIVLDRYGGALPRMARPFRLYVGGRLGTGKQWISWVHIDDVVSAIRYIIEDNILNGPVNLTAPNPVRQEDFAEALGNALQKPSLLTAPAFALEMLLGKERAQELLLTGLRVLPRKLSKAGFNFRYPDLESALGKIYGAGE